jgi:hypothetical protein
MPAPTPKNENSNAGRVLLLRKKDREEVRK